MVTDGWTNVKGNPSINVLGVSASRAVFLSTHDYLDKFKTDMNIAELLLKNIETIGPYNVIQVITDNVANCKATRAIIEDKYPNILQRSMDLPAKEHPTQDSGVKLEEP